VHKDGRNMKHSHLSDKPVTHPGLHLSDIPSQPRGYTGGMGTILTVLTRE